TNQVKQLALAVHGYADVHTRIPPLWMYLYVPSDPATGAATAKPDPPIFGTLHYLLLPYLELQNTYDAGFNPATGWYQSGYLGSSNMYVGNFLCPSDGSFTLPLFKPGPWCSASYAGNCLVFDPAGGQTLAQAMPDGTSNVIMFAERLRECVNTG